MKRDRPNLLMAGCMRTSTNKQRHTKLMTLLRNGFKETKTCSNYVETMLTSKFVASFTGNGGNNCREWEALVAGAIPLVDAAHTNLAPVFEGMPVVRVHDWSKVTPSLLEAIWHRMQEHSFDLRKAYFPYWIARIADARRGVLNS